MRSRRRRAVTLLELMLVAAIMLMFAALSYPTLAAMYADIRLQGASDAVRAAWSEAQAHAVDEGRAYRFAIVPGKGNYRVAPDSDEFWEGSGNSATTDSDNPPYILEGALPKAWCSRTRAATSPTSPRKTPPCPKAASPSANGCPT